MKKIFTLAAAVLFALGASAQAMKLDNNLVIYFTSDTVSVDAQGTYPWTANSTVDALNNAGLACSGQSGDDYGYKLAFRNDYKDPQTGFSIKKGYYRGVLVNGNWTFAGTGHDNTQGFTNIKQVIMYFVGLPQAYVTSGGNVNHQDYPTGRVYATYMNSETGAKLSNQAYRECHISMNKTDYWKNADGSNLVYGLDNFLGYNLYSDGVSSLNPNLVTYDQPFKMVVDLTNSHDGKYYEDIFENPTTKQSEFVNFMCDGKTEGEMSYYFADPTTCEPSYTPTAGQEYKYASASGYDCYGHKWGTKVAWTPETCVQVGIKKRMLLVGVAFVSATEGATSKFLNTGDYNAESPKFGDQCDAFGNATPDMDATNPWKGSPYMVTDWKAPQGTAIQTVNAANEAVATPAKSIENGRVVISKNGHKYTAAGAMLK